LTPAAGSVELEPMSGTPEPQARSGVCTEETGRETAERLAAIRRGDPDAFEAVAREHAPALYRMALRLTGRREDAEDLVQETLVRALPRLRRFEGRAKLSTYLFRALSNLWKNRLRSKQRSRLVEWFGSRRGDEDGAPAALDPPDPTPLAVERLESEDRAAEVRQAVSRLEPTRRLTLLLREVEEMSYEEIAEVTGVPVGTVRSRLARAREDLRRLLEAGP
jgi:RNA polymerase sigma-70 factor (ECF subfamily)